MIKYEAILVGSGQAANPLARKLASAGWKTALIERQWIGGTCVNVGCTPTKALIASGRVAYLVKRSGDYGIRTTGFGVDVEAFLRRKNAVVMASRTGATQSLLGTPNLDLIFGIATFTGPKELTVTKEDGSVEAVTADHIFLDTGAVPFLPPVPGLANIPYLTSASILELDEIPEHLVIVGAGYVALEFGQLYRRLGSQVTMIENGDRFLPREDRDIANEIRQILTADGIRIYTSTHLDAVTPGDPVRLDLRHPAHGSPPVAREDPPHPASEPQKNVAAGTAMTASKGTQAGTFRPDIPPESLTATHVLVAAGRRPDTAGLNAEAAGIRLDERGYITVNSRLETSVPGIFAMGDVKGGPQFTHVAYNDHQIIYKNLVEKAGLSTDDRHALYCVFIDPELGRVGLTEDEARARGLDIKVATMAAAHVARAAENGETRGLLKVIASAKDRKILGAAMLITGGGELMSVVQMAMNGGLTYDKVRDGMYAHPTFAESLNNLFARL